MALHLTTDVAANELLTENPLALVLGMLLDQQVSMETAFAGPWKLQQRLGSLDAAAIAAADPEALVAAFRQRPAVHRYPGSMAARTQAVCRLIAQEWGGDASALWTRPGADGTAPTGVEVRDRLRALPGFGEAKAKMLLALLGKQCGFDGDGWREASAPYGQEGSLRSIADIVDAESLAQVRAFKKEMKAAARRG